MSLHQRIDALATEEPRLCLLTCVTGLSLLAFPLLVLLVQFDGGPFRFGGVDFKAYYLAGLRLRAGLPLYESGWFVEQVPRPRATDWTSRSTSWRASRETPLSFSPASPIGTVTTWRLKV